VRDEGHADVSARLTSILLKLREVGARTVGMSGNDVRRETAEPRRQAQTADHNDGSRRPSEAEMFIHTQTHCLEQLYKRTCLSA
jgi:hypothetical protein